MRTSEKKDYVWAVRSIRLNLSVLGLWTDSNNSVNSLLSVSPIIFANIYLFCFSIVPQAWGLYRVRKHFDLVLGNLMVLLTFCISIFKMFFLLKKKTVLTNFFVMIKEDWDSSMSEDEKEILVKYWKVLHRIHIYALVIALVVPLVYHSTILSNFVVRTVTNLTDIIGGRYFVQSSYYPFDTQSSPRYEIMIVNELLNGIVTCLSITVSDVLYSIFVLHACGQLEILAGRIRDIAINAENCSKLYEHHVRLHLRIIGFAKSIDDLFNGILLIVLSHFILVFCSQGFTALTTTSTNVNKTEAAMKVIFFLLYGGYVLFLNFLYCWAGDILITKSGEFHHAVYSCNWMDLPPKVSILLNLIQIRSQKPLAITAGKFVPVTLNTYLRVLKTCGGYISMLLAVNG